MSKEFYFKRTVTIEERFRVTMSDEMANESVAKNIIQRALEDAKLMEEGVTLKNNISWLDTTVIKTGKVQPC